MREPIVSEKRVEIKVEDLEFALHLEKVAETSDGKTWSAKGRFIIVNGLPMEGLTFSSKSDHFLLVKKNSKIELLEVNDRANEPFYTGT
jgi:hypothetical protein